MKTRNGSHLKAQRTCWESRRFPRRVIWRQDKSSYVGVRATENIKGRVILRICIVVRFFDDANYHLSSFSFSFLFYSCAPYLEYCRCRPFLLGCFTFPALFFWFSFACLWQPGMRLLFYYLYRRTSWQRRTDFNIPLSIFFCFLLLFSILFFFCKVYGETRGSSSEENRTKKITTFLSFSLLFF